MKRAPWLVCATALQALTIRLSHRHTRIARTLVGSHLSSAHSRGRRSSGETEREPFSSDAQRHTSATPVGKLQFALTLMDCRARRIRTIVRGLRVGGTSVRNNLRPDAFEAVQRSRLLRHFGLKTSPPPRSRCAANVSLSTESATPIAPAFTEVTTYLESRVSLSMQHVRNACA